MANWEWPVPTSSGESLVGDSPVLNSVPRRLRIGTFNIHSGRGTDHRLDLGRTAGLMVDFDFVGLNEVRGHGWSRSTDQAADLGIRLNRRWLFAPTEANWSGPAFGQGVLSRLPITQWSTVNFPRVQGNGYRTYVECQVPLESTPRERHLTFLVTHLDRKEDRQHQLRTIIQRFLELPPPVVLMGDLNAKHTEPQLRELSVKPGVVDCFGRFADREVAHRRIDWIFVRGLRCLEANLVETDASDHPFGWALVEIPTEINVAELTQ